MFLRKRYSLLIKLFFFYSASLLFLQTVDVLFFLMICLNENVINMPFDQVVFYD